MAAPRKTFWKTRVFAKILMQKSLAKLRLATINVATLNGRSAEVMKINGKKSGHSGFKMRQIRIQIALNR